MKQNLLNKLWLRVGMIVAIMTTALAASADEITILPSEGTAVESSNYTITKAPISVDVTASTLTSDQMRVFKNQTITISSETATITGITLTCAANGTAKYGPGSLTGTGYTAGTGNTGTWSGSTNSVTLTASSNQARITQIVVTYTPAGGGTPTCATPTFSPAAGAVVSGTEVTITSTDGATIYYTTNGQNPTTSSNVYSDPIEITTGTTIKAYAVKDGFEDSEVATASYTIKQAVSGYTIDFENDLDEYIDWTITNLTKTNEATAHGGSYFAKTNGTATAIVMTKEKVAYPNVFTCYISKIGTNTNTNSYWKIQVSSDGSTWTDIATHAAAVDVTAGTWYAVTGDIKAAGHTNVYVRLYYTGTTAVRTVDDISLTTYTPAAVEEPVISVTTPFTFSTTATITCVTEGATIYYSYDNSTWTEYTEGLPITSTTTIYAKAVKGSDESTVAQVTATKELATPTVEISATSFNIGETATVTTDGPAVTLTTSAAGVASVSGTTVTGVAAGTATITATWSANSDYSGGTQEFAVTVTDPNAPGSVNNPYTIAEAIDAIENDGNVTDVCVAGIVSQVNGYYSNKYITYWISTDGTTNEFEVYNGLGINGESFSSVDDVQIGDQVVVKGNITYYEKNGIYEFAANNQLVSLVRAKTNPTIVVNSTEAVAYGSTFTVDDSVIEGGEITVTSSNTAVATVSGLVITPVAVGTTTITVATAENTSYNAGSETFTLTVTAPVGGTEAPTGSAGGTIFEETFADCVSTGGNDNNFATAGNTEISTANDYTDNDGWVFSKGYPADGCVKFGGSKAEGEATTPSITATVGTTYTLTFKAAPWSSESATMNVSVEGGTISGISEDAMSTGEWNDFTASITATATSFTVTFAASKNRFFLDEVKVVAPATPAPEIKATLNGSGYATFCSEYPLDFSEVTDFSAWQITDIDGDNKITFEQVTGSVKGGTGLFLKGEAGATVTIPSADSSNELTKNLLVGTLAPSYFEANKIYGLAGNTFKKNSAGSIRANKAYIPANLITVSGSGSSVKPFTFVFDDDATGISLMEDGRSQMEDGVIYNLAGQRLDNSQFTIHNSQLKRGIYIVNGKKILK